MKKLIIITLLLAGLFTGTLAAEEKTPISVGLMAGYPSNLVFGFDKFDIGVGSPYIAGVYIFADYKFLNGSLPLEGTNPLLWNVGAGVSTVITSNPGLSFAARLPVAELAWTIPNIAEERLQLWIEAGFEIGLDVLPVLDLYISGFGGIGLRVYLS